MVPLAELLLPILLSAVAVFLVSSVVHMVLPIHRSDYKKMPGEAEVLAAIRQQGVRPGEYMFPCAGSMKEMATPEMVAKLNEGPVGTMVVIPSGPFKLGKSLGLWFAYCLFVGLLVAYLAGLVIGPGDAAGQVFRFTSAAAFLAHAPSNVTNSIWKGVSWATTFKFVFDGLLYSLATGAMFAWLWPGA